MKTNLLHCRHVTNVIMWVHLQIKFKCNLCTEEFANKSNLNRPVSSSHKELTPYSCPICYKGFVRKDSMKRHTATKCYKSFGQKWLPKIIEYFHESIP